VTLAWLEWKPLLDTLQGRERTPGLWLAGVAGAGLGIALLLRLPHWLRARRHPTLTALQLEEMLQGPPPLLVDLREPESFRQEGHIRGALHVPYPQLGSRIPEILAEASRPVPRAIVLVDEHDPVAHRAADQLRAAGADWLYVLMDGFHGWRRGRFPVVK
jgi:rhodanese-related sulfurtransferase